MSTASRNLLVSVVASSTPTYAQGMADYEVRHLTGATYGPANGIETLQQLMPTEWNLTGGDYGTNAVFSAYTGGKGDTTGRKLYFTGGGHGDSANNGLYCYDFNGARPTGYSIVGGAFGTSTCTLSPRTHVPPKTDLGVAGYLGDGKGQFSNYFKTPGDYYDFSGNPSAIHTWDNLWFDPVLNRFYRVGGSPWWKGSSIANVYAWEFNSNKWTLVYDADPPPYLATSPLNGGETTIGAPDGSKLLVLRSNSSQAPVFIPSGGGWVVSGSQMFGSQQFYPTTSNLDTKRSTASISQHLVMGYNGSLTKIFTIAVNWAANTYTTTNVTFTGTDAGLLAGNYLVGSSLIYDELRDCYWQFGSRAETGSITSLFEIDATTWAVTRHVLSTPIPTVAGMVGSFNRHVWLKDWRCIGTVHGPTVPPSIIKLPD